MTDWIDLAIEMLKWVFLWPLLSSYIADYLDELMVIILQIVWLFALICIISILWSGGSSLLGKRK